MNLLSSQNETSLLGYTFRQQWFHISLILWSQTVTSMWCPCEVTLWWHLCSHIYLIIASQTVVSLRCPREVTLWDLCDLTYYSYCDLKLWYHCGVPVRLHFETTVISHISNTVIFLWYHCELAVVPHSWLGSRQPDDFEIVMLNSSFIKTRRPVTPASLLLSF